MGLIDNISAELARLRRENDALRADLASIRSVYDFAALEAKIAELRADRDNSNRLLDECRHERNILQKICAERSDDIEKLRAVLKPFADLANAYAASEARSAQHHKDEGRTYHPHSDGHRVSIGLGECRRASQALEQKATGE